jgi:hypothetical protein
MTNEYSIAVLLPTRGRTDSLTRSVSSIIENATAPDRLELLFGFDDDDAVGQDHFAAVIQPDLDSKDISYQALSFESMGYEGLNRYYNTLSQSADADWLFVWNDDATMDTQGWDDVVRSYDGQFVLLKVHTHNEHPYSIFPIVPRTWVDLLGVLSRHQLIDAEISQNAYMLDIMQIVDITVTHEQSELTGKHDETSQRKYRFENNQSDPRDFHFKTTVDTRFADCRALAAHMKSQNLDTTFFENIWTQKQDPWEKLKKNDINHFMHTFETK